VHPEKKKSVEVWQDLKTLEDEAIVIDDIKNYISRLVVSTHPIHSNIPAVKQFVLYGASPRAGIYLLRAAKWKALLENRINVSFEDIEELAYDVLNHRIILNFDAEAENVEIGKLLQLVVLDLEKRYKPRA
jgi:MoxR-like ATPase